MTLIYGVCKPIAEIKKAAEAAAAAAAPHVPPAPVIFAGPTCASCGAPLSEGDAFCMSCGTPLVSQAEEVAAQGVEAATNEAEEPAS